MEAELNKIFQTDTSVMDGNSLQAALATILGKAAIEDIPYFSHPLWRQSLSRYLFDEHKKFIMSVVLTGNGHQRALFEKLTGGKGYCLVLVESFRHFGSRHFVVGAIAQKYLTIVHDPDRANAKRQGYEYDVREIFFLS